MLRNLLSPIFRLPRRQALPFVPVRAIQTEAMQPESIAVQRAPRIADSRRARTPSPTMRSAHRYSNQLSS
jgi:hypothetical protein